MRRPIPNFTSQEDLQQRANAIITPETLDTLRGLAPHAHLRLAYAGLAGSVSSHEAFVARGASQPELDATTYGTMLMRGYVILAARAASPDASLPPLEVSASPAPSAYDALQSVRGPRRAAMPAGYVLDVPWTQTALDQGKLAGAVALRTDPETRLVWFDVYRGDDLVLSLPLSAVMIAAFDGAAGEA